MKNERQESSPNSENYDSFLRRVESLPEKDQADIRFAYQIAKSAHRGQRREGNDRYFEHVRATALILIDECGIQKKSLIAAALLHDSMEDTAVFGNPLKTPYSQWTTEARDRLALNFGEETAEIVVAATKPQVDGQEILTKEQALHFYHDKLRSASPSAILVKMADRLHNLRTLNDTPIEKQRRKVKETKDVYIPLFQRALSEYPREGEILSKKIRNELHRLEESFQTPS
jgi:guanosine-3',5'-bis(diphosphate) 3'-pyrophosphohydrolase